MFILTFIGSEDDSVSILHNTEDPQLDVGHGDLLAVHLDPHLLKERDLGVPHPHRHSSQPREGQGAPGIIGDPDGEAGVGATVTGQQVLARALEVEDLSIECLVMWVSKDSADSISGRWHGREHGEGLGWLDTGAGGTTLARLLDRARASWTRWTRCGLTFDASQLAGTCGALVPVPRVAMAVTVALILTRLSLPSLTCDCTRRSEIIRTVTRGTRV